MDNETLRREAETYISRQMDTLREHGSSPVVSAEQREDLVVSAMRVAGFESDQETG
jgi:hypothetical protein